MLNASESAERCLPAAWDEATLRHSPVEALAAAYFDAIPDAFRRPDDLLYEYLGRELAWRRPARNRAGPAGLVRYVARAGARLRQWADLPLLDLDVSCADGAGANLANRIASFMEVLR